MARPVGKPGKRVNIYLDPASLKIAKQIDNLSEFIQVALSQAPGIMAFDEIKRQRGHIDRRPLTRELIDTWNENHPLDRLTAKRLEKKKEWPNTPNSAPKQELW